MKDSLQIQCSEVCLINHEMWSEKLVLTPTWPRVTEDILLLLLLEDDSENSGKITDYFPDLAIIVFILKGHIPMQRISNN